MRAAAGLMSLATGLLRGNVQFAKVHAMRNWDFSVESLVIDPSDVAMRALSRGLWMAQTAIAGRPIPPPPFVRYGNKRSEHAVASVRYNATKSLDIWQPQHLAGPAPVLLFIPGGGWVIGHRRPQGYALMSHLVERGWICLAIDYSTAPLHHWPAPYEDVQDAMAWAKAQVAQWGGDPESIAIGGASAGGHMASLYGLAWDHPDLAVRPGFKPMAVASLYGVYNWEFRRSVYHTGLGYFLERVIVGESHRTHPEIFHAASPTSHARTDAPPFLLVHGNRDHIVPVEGARRFANKLARVSKAKPVYYGIPNVGHGFDLLHPRETELAVQVIGDFLNEAYLASQLKEVS